MATGKDYRKLLDQIAVAPYSDEATNIQIVMRTAMRVAMDTAHKDYGAMAKYLLDQTVGRAVVKVESQVTATRGVALCEAGAALLGITTMQAEVVNDEGEVEAIAIDLGGDESK